ncbi:MAG: MoaD/ThiS family protein [Bacteroidetes bacterium]|nr:MoaD/ThiS family protein [Bacteroidota bacterium]
MIAETIGKQEEKVEIFSQQISVALLVELLLKKYPNLNLKSFKIAVNQSVAENAALINENDEIALLPPFAGG